MNKLVSVIIPVYNAQDYIVDALNSIMNQTYENIEVIIVNDGSTDDSLNILMEKFSNYSRIIIVNSTNKGQSYACNLGYKYATGDLIKFFDADDILNPEFIKEQVELLKGSNSKICSSKWGRFYNNDIGTFSINKEIVWNNFKPIDWIILSLESGSNMLQCAIWLIPREIIEKAGLWDISLSLNNDFEFFIRILLASDEIIFSPNSVLYYRSGNSQSLSQIFNRTAFQSAINSNILGCNYIILYEDSIRTRNACINNLKIWMFKVYPHYKDLSLILENNIIDLGVKKLSYVGGKIAVFLSKIFGWKIVVLIGFYKRNMFKWN